MTVAQEAPRAASPKRRRVAAAAYIREQHGIPCSPNTLAKLACLGGGPAFYKAGRVPLYAQEDLDAWACAKLSPRLTSTSDLAA